MKIKRILVLLLSFSVFVSSLGTIPAQEQKVLWRQIKIGSYSVTWPGSQGAADTVLKNDGSGNLSWGTVSSGGGYWSRTAGTPNYLYPTTTDDQIRIPNGSLATPSLVFADNYYTTKQYGLYRPGYWGFAWKTKTYDSNDTYVLFEYGSLSSSSSLSSAIRLTSASSDATYGNFIESRNSTGAAYNPLHFNVSAIGTPSGTETLPAIWLSGSVSKVGIYHDGTNGTAVMATNFSGYRNYTHFGGRYGGDGGIYFRRSDNSSGYENTVASYQYDGSTLTKLRLKGNVIEIATGTSGTVLYRLPTALPTSNGQCLKGNTDGSTYWESCVTTTTTSTTTSTSTTSTTLS